MNGIIFCILVLFILLLQTLEERKQRYIRYKELCGRVKRLEMYREELKVREKECCKNGDAQSALEKRELIHNTDILVRVLKEDCKRLKPKWAKD